jgi:hypothetical protein
MISRIWRTQIKNLLSHRSKRHPPNVTNPKQIFKSRESYEMSEIQAQVEAHAAATNKIKKPMAKKLTKKSKPADKILNVLIRSQISYKI